MGRYYRDPNTGNKQLISGGTFFSDNPIGSIIPFGGNTAPKGWFICDGSAKSRTEYPELFAAIGTSYGAGDGSTTFNLPDLRGRVLVGLNSSETEFNSIGKTGGEKTHTLVVDEMPSHTHTQNSHNHTQNAHSHPFPCSWEDNRTHSHSGSGRSAAAEASSPNDGQHSNYSTSSTTATNNATTATNQNTGGGQSHNNLQPFTVSNYIIKAFSTALPADWEEKVYEEITDIIGDIDISDIGDGTVTGGISALKASLNTITPYITTTVLKQFTYASGAQTYTPTQNAIIAGRIEPGINHTVTITVDGIEVGRAYVATNNAGVAGYGEAYYIPVKAGQEIKLAASYTMAVCSLSVYAAQN